MNLSLYFRLPVLSASSPVPRWRQTQVCLGCTLLLLCLTLLPPRMILAPLPTWGHFRVKLHEVWKGTLHGNPELLTSTSIPLFTPAVSGVLLWVPQYELCCNSRSQKLILQKTKELSLLLTSISTLPSVEFFSTHIIQVYLTYNKLPVFKVCSLISFGTNIYP